MNKFKRILLLLLLTIGLVVANVAEAVVGDKGPIGNKGPVGDKGPIGNKGPAGNVGATGLTGLKGSGGGAKGDKGIPGTNGTNGDKGDKGDQGLPGETGLQGDQGSAGTFPVGIAIGGMQWWNGSSWVRIPVGVNNTTLKNCNGVPTWVVASCPSFIIGETGPAGGIVFYLTDSTGAHGLEVSQSDYGIAPWGCSGKSIPNANGESIGTGAANTAAIVAGCSETGIAAKSADFYSFNGYDDWYLASNSELVILFRNIPANFFSFGNYWSSTQHFINNDINISNIYAESAGSNGNNGGGTDKSQSFYIRPIRSF